MPHNLFIDLDGTLIDPKVGITGSIRFALRELGIDEPSADELEWCIGPPLSESFPVLLGPDEDVGRAISLYRDRFSQTGMYEARPYAGVHDMLANLKSAGVRCFLATSKPQVFAERIIEHFDFDPLIDGVFGSELDGRRVDKTELIRFVLERTAAAPGSSRMMGDRRHDIAGARNNGIGSIGVLWGYGTSEELCKAGADVLVHRPDEVPEVLTRFAPGEFS
ncbi:MAG: HAD hydrolase-like protein [Rhodobacteraceae bacterium]|nr:HAD hydrolase-like protein [Paracoccaceae bacterium]MCY4136753.1 HAD hydrolase-like protein [Paracoccaceae bacterium]